MTASSLASVLATLCFAVQAWESSTCREPSELSQMIKAVDPVVRLLRQLPTDSRIAGDNITWVAGLQTPAGILWNSHTFQSLIRDEELIRRWVMNCLLLGMSDGEIRAGWPYGIPRGEMFGEERTRWGESHVRLMIDGPLHSVSERDFDEFQVKTIIVTNPIVPRLETGSWQIRFSSPKLTILERQRNNQP